MQRELSEINVLLSVSMSASVEPEPHLPTATATVTVTTFDKRAPPYPSTTDPSWRRRVEWRECGEDEAGWMDGWVTSTR